MGGGLALLDSGLAALSKIDLRTTPQTPVLLPEPVVPQHLHNAPPETKDEEKAADKPGSTRADPEPSWSGPPRVYRLAARTQRRRRLLLFTLATFLLIVPLWRTVGLLATPTPGNWAAAITVYAILLPLSLYTIWLARRVRTVGVELDADSLAVATPFDQKPSREPTLPVLGLKRDHTRRSRGHRCPG
jgi:hypothetical protein